MPVCLRYYAFDPLTAEEFFSFFSNLAFPSRSVSSTSYANVGISKAPGGHLLRCSGDDMSEKVSDDATELESCVSEI